MRPSRRFRSLVLGIALAALIAMPAQAAYDSRENPGFGRKAFDAVVLRPLGLVQTVAGAGFFLVFYPVSLVAGGSDHVVDYCIRSPVEQTFRRPLGEL